MLPLLIGVAALLLVGGKKKKPSSKGSGNGSGNGNGNGNGNVATLGMIKGSAITQDVGEPWDQCDPPSGFGNFTHAAYGLDGKCMVFWDASTRDVARAHIEAEMAKLSEAERAEACGPGECDPDPYAADPELFCEWQDNPKSIEVIIRVITKMYPQLSGQSFPMPYSVGVSFFPATVWTFVSQTFLTDFCGFNKVT